MYTLQVPFKDLHGKPHNTTLYFNLFEREVIKLIVEFKKVFEWFERSENEDFRMLEPEEVVEFFNNFEEILLSAVGTPSSDGLTFDHSNRYKIEDSAAFNAAMVMFLQDTKLVGEALEGIVPTGFADIIKKADENLAVAAKETENEDLKRTIAELREQLKSNGAVTD